MGRQHIRDGVFSVRQVKTGAELMIPVHPELATILDETPRNNLTFLMTQVSDDAVREAVHGRRIRQLVSRPARLGRSASL